MSDVSDVYRMPEQAHTVVRHCILPDCDWSYTEPPCRPVVAMTLDHDLINEAINRATMAHVLAVEAVLSEHAHSHDVVEYVRDLAELRQALGTARPDHPLLEITSPATIYGGRTQRL